MYGGTFLLEKHLIILYKEIREVVTDKILPTSVVAMSVMPLWSSDHGDKLMAHNNCYYMPGDSYQF